MTITLKLSDICRALISRRQPRILGMSPEQWHRRAMDAGIPHDETACVDNSRCQHCLFCIHYQAGHACCICSRVPSADGAGLTVRASGKAA
jgi:hypothetical protein